MIMHASGVEWMAANARATVQSRRVQTGYHDMDRLDWQARAQTEVLCGGRRGAAQHGGNGAMLNRTAGYAL